MATLDTFVATKLAALGLKDDEETRSFVTGIVQEDSFELEASVFVDKKVAILGMLEAEDDEATATSVDELLQEAGALRDEQIERERLEGEARSAQTKGVLVLSRQSMSSGTDLRVSPLYPGEQAPVSSTYGFVEEEDEQAKLEQEQKEGEEPSLGDGKFVDPRYLSKKARKKAEQGVDILMQPNMNAAIVRMAEQHKRKEAAAGAASKREKDKADLKKQKEDAAKKLADKQKKAQKHERKG
ncbi:hypothetical protein OIO90_005384 [Microbotryomycetes sp. JL221]|nr:hypothetical protein OIO90_005384 [Microbotryomycetes sp. JL221]